MTNWLIEKALWIQSIIAPIAAVLLFISILILPFAIFRKTRPIAGTAFIISSFVYGAALWFWTAAIALILWGLWGLLIGFFLAGIGVVAVAFLASIFNGQWVVVLGIIFGIAIAWGTRIFGYYLLEKDKT